MKRSKAWEAFITKLRETCYADKIPFELDTLFESGRTHNSRNWFEHIKINTTECIVMHDEELGFNMFFKETEQMYFSDLHETVMIKLKLEIENCEIPKPDYAN